MAKFISLLFLALIAISMVATTVMANANTLGSRYGEGSLKNYQCSGECNRRCKMTRYRKPCLVFCNQCCGKCLCVPPGYYGNKQVCQCYNNWKTKRGGPKCP